MEFHKCRKIILFLGLFAGLFLALSAKADNVGDVVNFNIDKNFDASGRTQVQAVLEKASPRLYFYVEKSWWASQAPEKQNEMLTGFDNLSNEFENNIYPKLTSVFGPEWTPGIDNDAHITVLFESMNSAEGGYFRENDEYEKLQLPDSNQREMLYLSVSDINSPDAKIVLAHEFTHLITFNQKNKAFGLEEDTWLNEGRAVYSSTILGYDNAYENSNLQQRVGDFIENPSDPLNDWSNTKYDYASVDMFMEYLADHYGINILSDSLKTKAIGIESINEALLKSGAKENFAQIFTNWTITLVVNDCSQNPLYCYINKNLSNLRISPTLIFLPLTGDSSLSSTNVTKNWAGNWQKIIGGSGNLKLDFSGLKGLNFQVPYILYDKDGGYSVKFLQTDKDEKGEIAIQDFGTNYKSLVIMPSLQSQMGGLENSGQIYPYSFTVSVSGKDKQTNQALIQKLTDQIASLSKQIVDIKAQENGGVPPDAGVTDNCPQFKNNLHVGLKNNNDVKCLQEFLRDQGSDIYPEGLITGNFGSLTEKAVIRFQEEYAADILLPIGLQKGSGYVGSQTRLKINQLLNAG